MNKNTAIENVLTQNFPGNYPLAVNIVKNGEVIYEKYSGLANREHQIPIKGETVFPISSVTKQFTAMIIMILNEEGRVRYSDPLVDYFPDFPHYGQKLTIEQLLHQVSGLEDIYRIARPQGLNLYGVTNARIYEFLRQQSDLIFTPGERFDYCNSNYMLLAMIAEQVCGKPFREILQEKIFTPLEMKHSGLYDARYIIPNRAYGYLEENGQHYAVDNQWLAYGDGGIYATIGDLVRWDQALYSDKLVSQSTLERAFTSGCSNSGERTGYGYGWAIRQHQGSKVVWHTGGDTGFGSIISRIPAQQLTIIMLSNLDGSWDKLAQCCKKVEEVSQIF